MVRKFHKDFVIFLYQVPNRLENGISVTMDIEPHGWRWCPWLYTADIHVAMMSMVYSAHSIRPYCRYPRTSSTRKTPDTIDTVCLICQLCQCTDTPGHHRHCVLYASYASAQIPPDIIDTVCLDVRGYRYTVFQTGYNHNVLSVIISTIISSYLICYNIIL